jgi:hypothetical protein
MKVTMDGTRAAVAYRQAFHRLRELPGFDHRTVLRAEAGSILKRWAGLTKAAKVGNVERHIKYLAWKNKWSREEMQTELARGVKSIGLARQSVIQIADDLRIDLASVAGTGISSAAVGRARSAIASSGNTFKNGTGTQVGDTARAYIQLTNRLPYGVKTGMKSDLARVLSGRAKFIQRAYKKGAFDSMRTAVRAFPNIFNTSGLSGT